jgi:hypothetical protein
MAEIIFYPDSNYTKDIIPPPHTIAVPDWFKKISQFEKLDSHQEFGSSEKLIAENGMVNLSAKHCMPMIDSFTTGYTFSLGTDIQVRQTDFGPRITWAHDNEDLREVRGRPDPKFPMWNGFDPFIFTWFSHWGIKTPKGYSCILTHPFNRTDLPFLTTTGIMDTDGWGIWGNQPFALQTGFEGIIPAGTPIIQIIPFKRENWKSKVDESLTEWANKENARRSLTIKGYYKNKYWQRKKYQ